MDDILISVCIPVMNRRHDLERTIGKTLAAAKISPPINVCILDYGSSGGLSEFMEALVPMPIVFNKRNNIVYARYNADHYHNAHAWNMAARMGAGEYLVMAGADALFDLHYFVEIRRLIDGGAIWMRGPHFKGIICVQRDEFDAAGGYDEQFEFYGSEDKDLEARLTRRGGQFGLVPDSLVSVLRTPNSEKTRNYRGNMTKQEMIEHNRRILEANNQAGVLVANEGRVWGQW